MDGLSSASEERHEFKGSACRHEGTVLGGTFVVRAFVRYNNSKSYITSCNWHPTISVDYWSRCASSPSHQAQHLAKDFIRYLMNEWYQYI